MVNESGITNVWAQPGARSEEIRTYCNENNMHLIEDCIVTKIACS